MFRKLHKRKAQTTLEYAILIGVIVASLIAMQTYVRRGFQGKLRDNADNMGEQFSPGHTTYNYTTISNSASTETTNTGRTSSEITLQTSNRTGNEVVETLDTEGWSWSRDN